MTVESGSMPSTSMDVQDGNSESGVEEYNNETAQIVSFSYKRYGDEINEPSLREMMSMTCMKDIKIWYRA